MLEATNPDHPSRAFNHEKRPFRNLAIVSLAAQEQESTKMHDASITGLGMVEEHEATGEVETLYEEIKRTMQLPVVPSWLKTIAVSPAALAIYWNFYRGFLEHTTLPQSLTAMILFTIAERRNCRFCSATNELTCRTLGIDDQTLSDLVRDLGNINPERIRAIIEYALKVSNDAQGLLPEDYERVRAQGVTDAELVEITLVAAIGNLNDAMADALKIEVDSAITEALERVR
jgi:alkylhydroperoxidase family enzyme